jgi:uncharacterized membrane protein YbhN (UPF0104 family)
LKGRAWAWVRLLGGVGILTVLVWRVGAGAFLDGLRSINTGTLAAALGIGALTTVFSAWRWCLVARGLGIRLRLPQAVADYYRALFLNAALPGGVLGDVHRAVRHGQDVGDVGRGLRAVVLERTAGQVVFVTVGVTTLVALPSPVLSHISVRSDPKVVLAAAAVAALLVGAVAWVRWRSGTARLVRALRTGLSDLRHGLLARRRWPGVLLASAIVLIGHLATFVVAARAAGTSAPVIRLLPLILLALLAMAVPLSVGGWGPREGVCAWAFAAAGLSAAQGLSTAVTYGLLVFVASMPGAGVLVARWVTRRRRPVRPPAPEAVVPPPPPAQPERSELPEVALAAR